MSEMQEMERGLYVSITFTAVFNQGRLNASNNIDINIKLQLQFTLFW